MERILDIAKYLTKKYKNEKKRRIIRNLIKNLIKCKELNK